ncbi:MAG TPA: hydrogenase expression/formation protein HypE [Oceanobacillus sp.]|nr:hydrogenase expression/formation protein HypE [Oceanobacillus sp.]
MVDFTLSCPVPRVEENTVLLAHGSGGRAMHRLLETLFLPAFSNPALASAHDGAVLSVDGARLAFTTDSYVVHPLFFPGGDIGALAVNGTVNDLAMCGACPLFLSAGFIIEEGLPMETLERVVLSMQVSAHAAGVQIVTGDTKVVDKGKGDGLFINTAGIGVIEYPLQIAPQMVRPGDVVIVNGDLGRHGMAIMAVREGLEFESQIESDCAPLTTPVLALLDAGIEVHCLRDLTRGGLASALCEIASTTDLHIHIEEGAVPVNEDVRGACEILGLDPLYVANEGRFVAFVAPKDAENALSILGDQARQIGVVGEQRDSLVTLRSAIGATRILDMLSGDQLPRIC